MTSGQWVVFTLAAHEYALPLEHVVEAIHMVAIVPAPNAPAWLAGVINLRGRVLPVMDLRVRLGLPPRAPDLSARILVTAVGANGLGLLVDAATEVLMQSADSVELPAIPNGLAVIRAGERLITVIDLHQLSAGLEGVLLMGTSQP